VDTIHTARHAAAVQRLIELRKRARLTQVDLAKRLRKSQRWVSHLERGQRRIDIIEWLDLSEAIGFKADRVLRELERIPRNRANASTKTRR
jgi:transcriptional regulator with XRE-family HTH domain